MRGNPGSSRNEYYLGGIIAMMKTSTIITMNVMIIRTELFIEIHYDT